MSTGVIGAAPACKPSSIDKGSIAAQDSVGFYFCETAEGGRNNVGCAQQHGESHNTEVAF